MSARCIFVKMRVLEMPPRARMNVRARVERRIVGRDAEQTQRHVRLDRDAQFAAVVVGELPAAVRALLAPEIRFRLRSWERGRNFPRRGGATALRP